MHASTVEAISDALNHEEGNSDTHTLHVLGNQMCVSPSVTLKYELLDYRLVLMLDQTMFQIPKVVAIWSSTEGSLLKSYEDFWNAVNFARKQRYVKTGAVVLLRRAYKARSAPTAFRTAAPPQSRTCLARILMLGEIGPPRHVGIGERSRLVTIAYLIVSNE